MTHYPISRFAGDQFDGRKIIDYIADTYRLKIPIYMLDEMVPTLKQIGALSSLDRDQIAREIRNRGSALDGRPKKY